MLNNQMTTNRFRHLKVCLFESRRNLAARIRYICHQQIRIEVFTNNYTSATWALHANLKKAQLCQYSAR